MCDFRSFSCGVPVISTDVGGIREFFPSRFGFLIDRGDENALKEKLIGMHQRPIQRHSEMHQYAKENFGPEKFVIRLRSSTLRL